MYYLPALSNTIVTICGLQGSGKTTTARPLASYLNLPFVDLDENFKERHRMSISDFIGTCGWDLFREDEGERVRFYHALPRSIRPFVLAVGGGTLLNEQMPIYAREGAALMKQDGPIIYLQAYPEHLKNIETLARRVEKDALSAQSRPAQPSKGSGNTEESAIERITRMYGERNPFLMGIADTIIYTNDHKQDYCARFIADKIPLILKNKRQERQTTLVV